MADENRVRSAARNVGGKLQDAVVGLTGDIETQPRGKASKAARTAQKAFGSVADTAAEWSGSLAETARDRTLTALLVAVSVGFVLGAASNSPSNWPFKATRSRPNHRFP